MISLILFWLAAAALIVAGIVIIIAPLRAGRATIARSRADSDVAVYRDQLEELERDLERGLIGTVEADAARTEISRRLLAADAARATEKTATAKAATRFAFVVAIALPLLAVPLYLYSGAPGLPSQPFAERLAKAPEEQNLEELVARVEEHLRSNPGDAEGWRVVAPIYARMGRFDDAADAHAKIIDLDGPTAQRLADLGEALVFAGEGLVTARAAALFDEAVRLDPENAQARYFTGLAALQEGNRARASEIWRALKADADPNAPWARMVSQSLAALDADEEAGGAPAGPAGEAIAGLPPEDRQQAIRGMVDGLDARLSEEGGTEAEWRQLIRARSVLGEGDAALDALNRAINALAPDAEAAARLISAARDMGVEWQPPSPDVSP